MFGLKLFRSDDFSLTRPDFEEFGARLETKPVFPSDVIPSPSARRG
jgi:hypothetical protein